MRLVPVDTVYFKRDGSHARFGDLNNGLDKAYEDKTLDEILSAPPSAFAGVTDKDAELLKEALGIQTVRDFGSNKQFALAGVLVALSSKTD